MSGDGFYNSPDLNLRLSNRHLMIQSGSNPVAAVPEPASWGMMILGMGMIGTMMRRRKIVTTPVSFAA